MLKEIKMKECKVMENMKQYPTNNEGFRCLDGYATDVIAYRTTEKRGTYEVEILLVKRGRMTEEGKPNASALKWALPGGFVNVGKENSKTAAARELFEETGIDANRKHLIVFDVRDNVDRDPRGQIASIVYQLPLPEDKKCVVKVGDDVIDYMWYNCFNKMPEMAFDHKEILENFIKTCYGPPFK